MNNEPTLIKAKFFSESDMRGAASAVDFSKILQKKQYNKFFYQFWAQSQKRLTFRGFHFQKKPHEQNKFILIHSGSLIDFVINIDTDSTKAFFVFKARAGDVIFVPNGYAHAYLCMEENVTMQYLMDCPYYPDSYTGFNGLFLFDTDVRKKLVISEKDALLAAPSFSTDKIDHFKSKASSILELL